MKRTREQKGITLIALIITIIVLLILAVVTINSIKNGDIIEKSKQAANDYETKRKEEESLIDHYMDVIEESQSGSLKHEGVIPEGGQYTAADGKIYKAGEKFPETVTNGDYYEFGDYKYTLSYNEFFEQFETVEIARETAKKELLGEFDVSSWEEFLLEVGMTEEVVWEELGLTEKKINGRWNVTVKQTNKTQYGEILEKINGRYVTSADSTFKNCTALTTAPTMPSNVTSMQETFSGCTALTKAPAIPNGVINMGGTFYNCSSLRKAPIIPSKVIAVSYEETEWRPEYDGGLEFYTVYYGCFEGCTSLEGEIEINANPTQYTECFEGIEKNIKIVGSCSQETKAALAATGPSGKVTY